MAAGIDLSALTMNPKEEADFRKFIIEQVFQKPELRQLHGVQTGVTMKEQIVFASQFGKTGIKGDSTCDRKTSGAKSTLSQKYWEPAGIEDTIINCNAELNGLFKAYFDKIQTYKEKYDISGTDLEVFLAILFEEAAISNVWRAIWFADLDVDEAAVADPGLIALADVKFYDYFDGLWKQIFTGVTATDISRVTISENAEVTPALQLTLAADAAKGYFEEVWALADSRLKADPNKRMYVSNSLWENYRQSLQASGENFTIDYTQEGFREIKWNGVPIINMENIWDLLLYADFVDNTTNNAYYLPNRIVLTTPNNIPVGTLNEDDFTEIDAWYEKKDRNNYLSYGFSLDSKLLEEYMTVVAY